MMSLIAWARRILSPSTLHWVIGTVLCRCVTRPVVVADRWPTPATSHLFPLMGGNGGEKTGRWCMRTFMTGSHFPSAAQPSTVPSGGKTPAWSRVSTPCWIRSSTWPKMA
jgi:hypothetical protein